MKHSDSLYLSAFDMRVDGLTYQQIAEQMGVSAATAKRWAVKGSRLWREKEAKK